ncbi:30S ribosomal protein S20 [Desulfofustis glycolicus]|uniref:Small ribosomal subunit protein bS20 n=1 Tax=Desulfofustis glycolicus DSM 9705 TaxID=1121409 RepID=A0A1M5Y2H9_9BACT|nr:30S ribosomal protein S20 [Desulfofustis glycolicus]MCB2214843.1 30S ribosomal protein S20 [Desulfobulbaceae bacterium]MEE4313052.1 30S ribosomal protein S20 [Desulfofustis sp.]SHI06212.1 small subunit ribosomal protein S20 [Desulfofustis glycolicus DSM 9705]
MANHKSAEKRTRQSQVRRMRNRTNRSKMKTAIKGLSQAIEAGSVEEAKTALAAAVPVIAKTASKGTIHKKNASRKISRLTKRVNNMETGA